MKIIQNCCKEIRELLGEGKVTEQKYKSSVFNYYLNDNDALYVFNTFTRAIAEITEEENALLQTKNPLDYQENQSKESFLGLIRARYLVASDEDETDTYNQFLEMLNSIDNHKEIQHYTILTTTGCNARCFYCFEADFKPVAMKQSTARDLGNYIADHCGGKKVGLNWFGGEPLCNQTAIDIICNTLEERNVPFVSGMVTNGFEIDEQVAQKARDKWKMTRAQITLDGLAEEHNRRKNFIGTEANPFSRIIRNTHLLLDADITVTIRLNFDENNREQIPELIDYLVEEFKGSRKLAIYPAILFEDCGAWNAGRDLEKNTQLQNDLSVFLEKLVTGKRYSYNTVIHRFKRQYCGANNPQHRTVSPEGKFLVCHNMSDVCGYGSIYEDITDRALYEKWMINNHIRQQCVNCLWLPECTAFSECPTQRSECIRETEEKSRHALIKTIRKKEKENNSTLSDNPKAE